MIVPVGLATVCLAPYTCVRAGEDMGEAAEGATPIRELRAGAAGAGGGDEAEH